MSIIEINTSPSDRELRWFGLIFAVFFALVGSIVWWKSGSGTAAVTLYSIGGGVAFVYYLLPPCRRRIYLGWVYAAYPIGWVMSHILLALIYYGVVTPVGLVLRLLGKDPLERTIEPDRESYWAPRDTNRKRDSYFRQF